MAKQFSLKAISSNYSNWWRSSLGEAGKRQSIAQLLSVSLTITVIFVSLIAIATIKYVVTFNEKRLIENMVDETITYLIGMDNHIPVMDGMEVTRIIRALPEGRSVKIVAVTASAFREQEREMQDAAAATAVLEPAMLTVLPAELRGELNESLKSLDT